MGPLSHSKNHSALSEDIHFKTFISKTFTLHITWFDLSYFLSCYSVLVMEQNKHYMGDMTSDPHPYVPDIL